MTGCIGIPCRDQGRSTLFYECLERLERPADTTVLWRRDNSVAKARNQIAREALAAGADWIWWLDDDLVFRADALVQTLRRPEEIVIGLSMMRTMVGGDYRPIWSNRPMHGDRWSPVLTIETGPNGLMPLLSGTGGGVLTRRRVFEVVPDPWWAIGQIPEARDSFWEDIYFYDQARAHGFEVWGDPSVKYGHETTLTIWPYEDVAGQWATVLALGFEPQVIQAWPPPAPFTVRPSLTAPEMLVGVSSAEYADGVQ